MNAPIVYMEKAAGVYTARHEPLEISKDMTPENQKIVKALYGSLGEHDNSAKEREARIAEAQTLAGGLYAGKDSIKNPNKYHSLTLTSDDPKDSTYNNPEPIYYRPSDKSTMDLVDRGSQMMAAGLAGKKYGPYIGGLLGSVAGGAISVSRKMPLPLAAALSMGGIVGGAYLGGKAGPGVSRAIYDRNFKTPYKYE